MSDVIDAHYEHGEPPTIAPCENCERCTWNVGPDCGIKEHAHCEKCGHCGGRHVPMWYAKNGWQPLVGEDQ